ncbi:TetR/AcrR family transcriptional regulator [Sphingobium amiense]|uniref:TetR/AcrR family transcriptional regulator n=1 Tax=Sphingobium amiense TaxID=135719 RepID=A0A494WCP7_9SPHN|nr:TetR/AcrR family transcriptional regulator [Sphingobium amiense]BBD98392.1 TetR/AcrR family transcriptional regulator [Sphingobium amiense]
MSNDKRGPLAADRLESAPRRPASLWKNAVTRDQERQAKRMAVLLTAADMFLARGSHRVAMTDIADELGITKPALYNYFSSKDDLLVECFRQSNQVIIEQLDRIERSAGPGLEKLRAIIRAYARLITVDYGSVMIRLEDRDLPDILRNEVRGYKRAIDARVRATIEGGIADGSILPCDVKLATFAIMGALNWIGQWFRSDGPYSVDRIGDEYADRLTKGLAKN